MGSLKRQKKVLVAMSGGVDSSVAAALLVEQGYEVVGCFMRLGSEDGEEAVESLSGGCDPRKVKIGHQGCCSVNDAGDARLVAAKLGVPLYVLNFKKDFGQIIDYFVGEYNRGRTPNPCVRCNDWLKFGKLMGYADSIGADFVATGHYAQLEHGANGPELLMGVDVGKDQSYVLFGSPLDRLGRMLLPVGGMRKSEVREVARGLGLAVSDKPDSQEICFVPDNNYFGLVKRRTPGEVQEGEILDQAGDVVGRHGGHQRYTIGQRRGVGVALGYPIYVVGKDPVANTVTVGKYEKTLASGLVADEANWLMDVPRGRGGERVRCRVKIRYNSPAVEAALEVGADGTFEVWFDQAQSAVTPGQAVVCYEGRRVIGGGWIRQAVSVDVGCCEGEAV